MKLSDKKVYPVSYKFEMFLVDNNLLRESAIEDIFLWLNNEAPGPMDAILVSTAKTMLETLGEYEHGTVEISTLFEEVASNIVVPGTDPGTKKQRRLDSWSKMEPGVTVEQDLWAVQVERAMLSNLCSIYSDLLLMMIAKAK